MSLQWHLSGIFMGLIAAGVYWAAAQLWPTSVAVILSLLATALVAARGRLAPRAGISTLFDVFVLFINYDALMALSAANVPFPLPAYLALGLIMVAAHAASRALVVSVMATESSVTLRVPTGDFMIALPIGLTPAVLLGIPGLIGLVAAIVMRLGLTACILPRYPTAMQERLHITRQVTEACFYLGALASWKYV